MAITVNRLTNVISVPQADLTPLGGSLFEQDVDAFRLILKGIEASEEGIVFGDTHFHETETTLAGILFARKVKFLSPYTITYEDLQYRVNLVGANNNITDVLNLTQVSVVPSNSAGLIKTEGGVTRPRRAKVMKNFTFVMFDEVSRKAKTGLTVTGQIRKDTGTFVALTNAPTEVSDGVYEISELTVAEMTADVVTLLFTATGTVAQIITIVTAGA